MREAGVPFTYAGVTREVVSTGVLHGRAVLLMHEMAGVTDETWAFAEFLGREYRVHLPVLFGSREQRAFALGTLPGGIQAGCVRAQFHLLEQNRPSPVAEWLRGLCRRLAEQDGGRPIGVVGMCLTGAMVFSMVWDPSVAAGVAAQPALPLTPGRGRLAGQLTASDDDIVRAARHGKPVLALQFTHDPICPQARLDRVKQVHDDAPTGAADELLRIVRFPTPSDKRGRQPRAHATLTAHAHHTGLTNDVPDSRAEVLAFLHEHLRVADA